MRISYEDDAVVVVDKNGNVGQGKDLQVAVERYMVNKAFNQIARDVRKYGECVVDVKSINMLKTAGYTVSFIDNEIVVTK